MTEEGLSPKEATRKAMHQISGAVIAITILAAVFVPALQAGSAGMVYKQFALDHRHGDAVLRVPRARLHPALCANLLKPTAHHDSRNPVFRAFNRTYDRSVRPSVGHIAGRCGTRRAGWRCSALALLCGFLFWKMPGSFPAPRRPGLRVGHRAGPPG